MQVSEISTKMPGNKQRYVSLDTKVHKKSRSFEEGTEKASSFK